MNSILDSLSFQDTVFKDDTIVTGVLALLLAFVFYTSSKGHGFWARFYKVVPALLMCYFLPSILNSFNIIDGETSMLYKFSKTYLLPACLVLLTLSIDLKGIINLGPKAIIMFLTGTVGIVIGGPIAILIVSSFAPEWVGGAGPDAVWRGMATVAGSWIGGGANQAAMKEVYEVSGELFSSMITVDIIVANVWMACLLYIAANAEQIDKKNGADTSAIDVLKKKMEDFQLQNNRIPNLSDLIVICGIAFGGVAIANLGSKGIIPIIKEVPFLVELNLDSKFLWVVIIATTVGVVLSFTKWRSYEGAGASKVGSVLLYMLVASIGMHMDVFSIFRNWELFIIGGIWMGIHVALLFIVAKLIKSPMFFLAVGSKANVGGAASAPVVASAFHPSLAPVGVLLAVLGYALGTYGALLCAILMKTVSE